MAAMLRLYRRAKQQAASHAAFHLQAHERPGFSPDDEARVCREDAVIAAAVAHADGADRQALAAIRLRVFYPTLRDSLNHSIANGTVF